MKPINPFSMEQWIAWIIATATAGVSGTVGLISYSESHYKSKEEAAIVEKFQQEKLIRIESQVDKLNDKLDRLLEDQ